jgi:hypothetical protein
MDAGIIMKVRLSIGVDEFQTLSSGDIKNKLSEQCGTSRFAFDIKPEVGETMNLSVQFARGFIPNDVMDDKSRFANIFDIDVKHVLHITMENAGYGVLAVFRTLFFY